jgi:hypothetical protein
MPSTLLTNRKVQIGAVVAGLTILALWAFSAVFVSPASRACLSLYREAKTAADTAHVDGVIPGPTEGRSPEARSCGSIRHASRWF